MSFATYAQIKSKVELDLDLQDEDFISDTELMGYCNEAIAEAESEILKITEDYFRDKATITLASGTAQYSLPSDIFGDKIRRVVYANGPTIYPVKRLRLKDKFERMKEIELYQNNSTYVYDLHNDLTDGVKLTFFPTPQESGAYITIWYIRNARQITQNSDVVDIPEFRRFIEQYMKVRCYEKEGNQKLSFAMQALEKLREQMISTLSNRVPDDEDEIEQDLSFYEEHV